MTNEEMTSARAEAQPLITHLSEVRMNRDDITRHRAQRLLKRQADLTAYSARRFADAVRAGDLQAARRWKREYQLSTACCRALGRQARGETAGTPSRNRPGGMRAGSLG
jgi:hypothetical protein